MKTRDMAEEASSYYIERSLERGAQNMGLVEECLKVYKMLGAIRTVYSRKLQMGMQFAGEHLDLYKCKWYVAKKQNRED